MNDFEMNVLFEAIKSEMKRFKTDNLYRCPHCEKIIRWDDKNYYPEEGQYMCSKCGCLMDEDELQALSLYEVIDEMYLAFEEKINKGEN